MITSIRLTDRNGTRYRELVCRFYNGKVMTHEDYCRLKRKQSIHREMVNKEITLRRSIERIVNRHIGSLDAIEVSRIYNPEFETYVDWHVVSDVLDNLRGAGRIALSNHRRLDGMTRYERKDTR